jgi:ribosomal protein S18 acetylase RimI-like enzyme
VGVAAPEFARSVLPNVISCDELASVSSRILGRIDAFGVISFWVETELDVPFSQGLYAQTRAAELANVAWTEEQKTAFCAQQFSAQHAHYETHYPNACFWLIRLGDTDIGRLYFEQTARELRLMEITIDAQHRNRGVGGAISGALLAHAMGEHIAMGLHVESFNPAKRLYERQGFRDVETRGIYVYMRVEAPASNATS